MLGINGDDEPKELVTRFARQSEATFPFLLMGRATAEAYALEAFPTVYFIDPQGSIADVLVGDDAGALRRKTAALVKKRGP